MGGMGGIKIDQRIRRLTESEEMKKLKRIVDFVAWAGNILYYVALAAAGLLALVALYFAMPRAMRFLGGATRRKRSSFEGAAFCAIGSVAFPILCAQAGLLLSGPVLPPMLGWHIFVYCSFVSGSAAVLLGAHALAHTGEPSQRKRAAFATAAGVFVLGMLYCTTRLAAAAPARQGLPTVNDVSTDVDEPPLFVRLADDNHTGGYPARNVPLLREFYADLLAAKTTSLPVGAAYIRGLSLAREAHWRVVTPIAYDAAGNVEPSEWMGKSELSFEATSTSHSPLFLIPDEIVVRVRAHTFDDGYVGAKVDVRSRGHLAEDHGANAARVRTFINHPHW